jgi:hypothetical protein
MTAMDRRHLLRIAAPAVALPVVATLPAQAKEQRLVTRAEIANAFRFFDGMELRAEDLNLRYQILIDMLFETNPETLRARLAQLVANRSQRSVLVDASTGQTAPYDPSMYEEQERLVQVRDDGDQSVSHWDSLQNMLPKPKLRTRLAAWLLGWRA